MRIVLSGWAEEEMLLDHFRQGAAAFAPGIPMTIVDGTDPAWRFRAWHAADIFSSPTDNIQETLSQTILEAQSCGLPVVVTDWDGCRDEVEDGVTGYLVPTRGVIGATANGTSRYMLGETSYAEFLAETNQTVAVDVEATRDVFMRLFTDPELRSRMGAAARERICSGFTWQQAVKRHEQVWQEQEQVRQDHAASHDHAAPKTVATPVLFPDVETSFASYQSKLLGDAARLAAADDAEQRLAKILELPLTSYRGQRRVTDHAALARLLAGARQPLTMAEAEAILGGVPSSERSRATIAWMLKYDLLRLVGEEPT